jgi:hypothetical protein
VTAVTAQEDEPTIIISNEFAAIAVRRVATRNGERLEIRSLGHDRAVRLDALALEALTWSTPLEVGKGLETPLGPDPSEPHAAGGER